MSDTLSPADSCTAAATATEVCSELSIASADRLELFRYLGYPANATPAPRAAEQIEQLLTKALPSLHPRGAYAIYPVEGSSARRLQLGGVTFTGNIGEFLSAARRVAVFVVTVGEEISQHAEQDAFSAWTMDATGSWAVEAAADALMLRLRPHLGEGEELTLRYSPGYCGMEIGQQRNLFQLVNAEAVGVRLMPSMLMHPLKSISGLVGFAPKESVAAYRSPCDLCQRTGCHMRR